MLLVWDCGPDTRSLLTVATGLTLVDSGMLCRVGQSRPLSMWNNRKCWHSPFKDTGTWPVRCNNGRYREYLWQSGSSWPSRRSNQIFIHLSFFFIRVHLACLRVQTAGNVPWVDRCSCLETNKLVECIMKCTRVVALLVPSVPWRMFPWWVKWILDRIDTLRSIYL